MDRYAHWIKRGADQNKHMSVATHHRGDILLRQHSRRTRYAVTTPASRHRRHRMPKHREEVTDTPTNNKHMPHRV